MSNWSSPTTRAEVIARAGGRRHYNSVRQFHASMRRVEVLRLLHAYGTGPGVRARIARELGVHRSTITRDVQAVLWANRRACPTCRTMIANTKWKKIALEGRVFGDGPHPLSSDGQEEIAAVEAVQAVLPVILGDLGFFVDEDGAAASEERVGGDAGMPAGGRIVLADLVDRVMRRS